MFNWNSNWKRGKTPTQIERNKRTWNSADDSFAEKSYFFSERALFDQPFHPVSVHLRNFQIFSKSCANWNHSHFEDCSHSIDRTFQIQNAKNPKNVRKMEEKWRRHFHSTNFVVNKRVFSLSAKKKSKRRPTKPTSEATTWSSSSSSPPPTHR